VVIDLSMPLRAAVTESDGSVGSIVGTEWAMLALRCVEDRGTRNNQVQLNVSWTFFWPVTFVSIVMEQLDWWRNSFWRATIGHPNFRFNSGIPIPLARSRASGKGRQPFD
jgi:hypothetical protein